MLTRSFGSIFLAAFLVFTAAVGAADEIGDLKTRVSALEKRLDALEKASKAPPTKTDPEQLLAKQQEKARERMRKDEKRFSPQQLREIDALYQTANQKWQSPEAQESLKKLLQKYKTANRTGCAVLYLGQMNQGDKQIRYLRQAINVHEDCFYGDGVQVGAFARYLLGKAYLADGNAEKAAVLFEELRKDYADSIDHHGQLLIDQLPPAKAEKQE